VTPARKPTRNQALVLDLLEREERAMTVREMLEGLRPAGLRARFQINEALQSLGARGLVQHIATLRAWVACRHRDDGEVAAFAICDDCRTIWRFTLPREALTRVPDARGFTTRRLTVELHGSCVDCGGELPEGLGQGSELEFVAGFDARPVAGFDDPEEDEPAP
jgi:Fur family zinc uptake transcriptional regulator